jgi:hypothetical protein
LTRGSEYTFVQSIVEIYYVCPASFVFARLHRRRRVKRVRQQRRSRHADQEAGTASDHTGAAADDRFDTETGNLSLIERPAPR